MGLLFDSSLSNWYVVASHSQKWQNILLIQTDILCDINMTFLTCSLLHSGEKQWSLYE